MSNTTPTKTSVYRLTGKDLLQWWQVPTTFWRTPVKFKQNVAIKHVLQFLIILPLYAAFAVFQNHAAAAMLPLVAALFLSGIAMLLYCTRHHLRHVVEVNTAEEGLLLKSPWMTKQVSWLDIERFDVANDSDGTVDEYILTCKNGEQFFLAKELTDSAQLFEVIALKAPSAQQSCAVNYCIDDGEYDMPLVCCWVMFAAVTMGPARALIYNINPSDTLNSVITFIVCVVLIAAFAWLHLSELAQVVRFSKTGLYLQTRTHRAIVPLQQIKSITQIGWWIIIKTNDSWFAAFLPKMHALNVKLIESTSAIV